MRPSVLSFVEASSSAFRDLAQSTRHDPERQPQGVNPIFSSEVLLGQAVIFD